MIRFLSFIFLNLFAANNIFAQVNQYEIDLKNIPGISKATTINMKGENPQGVTLGVNNQYFEKNGKAWFPIMGELHYNRVRPADWEEEIIKMKSGGLSIIATYVFWNEHETAKDVWDWEDNRNLRRFLQLCHQNGMYVWLRIGPWCHGEQLNGGHPDWINKMQGKRSNNPAYLDEVTKLFNQVGKQANGLFFKDGGPVIGVQLENEYASGQAEHISMLKTIALAAQIQPVYWTVTGNTVFDDTKMEVIPLQGAYPYRGWESGGGKATKDFLYGNDQWILTDALGKVYYDITKFPKGLCEQGCGSEMTYANRFIVEPHIIEAHLQNQVGRGMNLVGYYMFHGGTQTPGLKEPGVPENYDFQAPISEFGYLQPSYKYLKILHNFINDFGSDLAQMQVVEQETPVRNELDTESLRYITRVKDNSGFVFLGNAQVRVTMPDKRIKLKMKLPGEVIEFPELILKGQTSPILPFNLLLNKILIKYATAQPFAKIENDGNLIIFFQKLNSVNPQLGIDGDNIKNIDARGWTMKKQDNQFILASQKGNRIHIQQSNGKIVTLIFLSRNEAENSWRVTVKGKEALVITNADLLVNENGFELHQLASTNFSLKIYPSAAITFTQLLNKKEYTDYSMFTANVKNEYKAFVFRKKNAANIEVEIPATLPASLNDIFAKVDYYGGSAEVWQNGKLITDHLFNGPSWLLGMQRFLGKGIITINAKDWKNNITGVADSLVNKIRSAGTSINKIEIIPQYKLNVNYKNK